MTAYCLIEPAFIAVPPLVDQPQRIVGWLGELLEFGSVSRERFSGRLLLPPQLPEALEQAERTATYASIRKMLQENGLLEVFSAGDVLRTIQWLMDRLKTIEASFAISTAGDIHSIDPELLSCSQAGLANSLNEMLVTACSILADRPDLNFLMATPLDGPRSTQIKGERIARRVEEATGNVIEDIEPFHAHLPLVRNWPQFLMEIDDEAVWCEATGEIDLEFALLVRAAKVNCSVGRFTFGNGFIESLRLNSAWREGRFTKTVLRTCADVLFSAPNLEFGPFFSDRPRSIQATKAGGFSGWRTHVTRGGVGLRLMYWKNSAGDVEFSRIGPKQEGRME